MAMLRHLTRRCCSWVSGYNARFLNVDAISYTIKLRNCGHGGFT